MVVVASVGECTECKTRAWVVPVEDIGGRTLWLCYDCWSKFKEGRLHG